MMQHGSQLDQGRAMQFGGGESQASPTSRRVWSVIVYVKRDRKIPTSTNTSDEHEFMRLQSTADSWKSP
jgi:hypothetical protein